MEHDLEWGEDHFEEFFDALSEAERSVCHSPRPRAASVTFNSFSRCVCVDSSLKITLRSGILRAFWAEIRQEHLLLFLP